jgi:hypothetical protein
MEFDRFTDENYDGLLARREAFEGTKSNCRPSHAVQIEKSLRGKSPENGNISDTGRRLSAFSR